MNDKLTTQRHTRYLNDKISNNDLTADQINILNETGQLYIQNESDLNQNNYTLSLFEKKSALYKILKEITTDRNINEIISKLTDEDIEFVYNNSPYIISSLKQKYKQTTPVQFDDFVGAYKIQLIKTNGLITGMSDPLYSIMRASKINPMIKEHLKNRIISINLFNVNELRKIIKSINGINLLDDKIINKIKTLPVNKQAQIRDIYAGVAANLPTQESIDKKLSSLEYKSPIETLRILKSIINSLTINEDVINQIYKIVYSKEMRRYDDQLSRLTNEALRRAPPELPAQEYEPEPPSVEEPEPPAEPPVEPEPPAESEITGSSINRPAPASLLKEYIIDFMKKHNITEPSLTFRSSINKYRKLLKDKNLVNKFNNDNNYNYKLNGTIKNKTSKSKPYKRFGKYYINTNKLYGSNILSLRSQTDKAIKGIPSSMLISENIKNIIDKHFNKTHVNYNDIDKLTDYEKGLLNNLAYKAELSDILQIPTSKKSEIETDINKFMILKGEIESGNDNITIINDLKKLILKLSNKGILPKAESREILLDIISLGF